MAQSKELLIPVDEEYAVKVLKDEDSVKDVLESIRILATETVFDVSTKQGQKECASMAAKVAKCKTTIDGFGKDHVAGIKAQAADIDANRKLLRDSLDYLKQEVRQPLNEIEQAEKDRIAAHELIVQTIKDAATDLFTDVNDVQACIDRIQAMNIEALEEYAPEGKIAKADTLIALDAKLADMQKREVEQAELARLREEAIKNEAKLEAQKANEQARIASEQAAARKVAEAEERAKQAETAAQQAEQREKAKHQAELDAEADAKANREADLQHRQTINRQILADLMKFIPEETAKVVIRAIVQGEVSNTTINY